MIKKISSFLIRFGLSFALLGYLFFKMDRQKAAEVLSQADPVWLAAAFGVFVINNFVILGRWLVVMSGLNLKVSVFEACRSYLIGLFGNLFLPSSIGGDILKAYTLCKQSEERTKVVASVLLDRLGGFAGIVIMAVVSFFAGSSLANEPVFLLAVLALAGGSVLIGVILFNRKIYSWVCGWAKPFPKFRGKLMLMHDDIALLKGRPGRGAAAVVLSLAGQMCFIVVFYLIARSLGQDVSFGYFCIFVPLICVISMIPSIGGLGVREVGTAALFSRAGVSAEAAVGMSLTVFLFMTVAGLIGGLVYVATLYSRRVQYSAQNSVSSLPDA